MSSNCDLVFILDIGGCVVKGLTAPKVKICTLSVALHLQVRTLGKSLPWQEKVVAGVAGYTFEARSGLLAQECGVIALCSESAREGF